MNRCADVLATACTSELASLIRIAGVLELDKLTFNSSLKYALLQDPSITVQILSSSSFEIYELGGGIVRNDSPALASARISDFFLGAMRVKRQYETLVKMKDLSTSTAWLLVTAYYCAFFASIEINKLFGRISTSFAETDLASLAEKATGAQHLAFFQAKHTNFVGRPHAGKLVFQAVGTRPHAAAWQNALHVVRQVLEKYEWIDTTYYVSLLEDAAYSPSAVRNEWNYKRADYYGLIGEKRASNFKKIVGNPKSAHALLCQRKGLLDELDPCVIAILCEALFTTIDQSYQRAVQVMQSLKSN